MEAKFHMTREQNITVAKRNIVDYIWKSARLEGLSVTYPDTDTIFNGLSVQGVKVSDVLAINNLKHAWRFMLENVDYPIDYPFICKINQYVGGGNLFYDARYIRKIPVKIGGTGWKPDMPMEPQIKEEISAVKAIPQPTVRAITLILYLMQKQMFIDGNKRTAMLAANQVLISSGCGIVSVPIDCQPGFRRLLVNFYETGDMGEILKFVYDNCIDGLDFGPETPRPPITGDWVEPREGAGI